MKEPTLKQRLGTVYQLLFAFSEEAFIASVRAANDDEQFQVAEFLDYISGFISDVQDGLRGEIPEAFATARPDGLIDIVYGKPIGDNT